MAVPDALKDKVMLYDDNCPMCKAYTRGFVSAGLLTEEGRQQFSTAHPEIMQSIDLQRGRHEIPLYDTKTGKTIYGLDALFFILSQRTPFLQPLFRNSVFRAVLYQVYQVVTYNRRVIVGSLPPASGFDCAPDFNLKYRSIYIALALILATILANLCLPLLAIQAIAVVAIIHLLTIFFTKKRFDFIGQWATLCLTTAFLTSLCNILVTNNTALGVIAALIFIVQIGIRRKSLYA